MSSIKVLFSGDFAPVFEYEKILQDSSENLLGDLVGDIQNADFSFLNLEAPLTNSRKCSAKHGPNIKADPAAAYAIRYAGFKMVGLANNHIMDYGEKGLSETVNSCDGAGLLRCGAGRNIAEAAKPGFFTVHGMKIAVVAVAEHEFGIASSDSSGAAPLDIIANIGQLQVARQEADLVFFSIHGGNGHYPLPRPKLRDICRFLIDQGADGVFCHHAHIPGAYEIYNNKPISYSLGNLVFGVGGKKRKRSWSEGYLFEAEFSVSSRQMIGYRLIPYCQHAGQGGAKKLEGAEQSDFLARIKRLNEIVSSDEKLLDEWRMFCEKKSRSVIMEYFLPFRFRGIGILSRLFSLNGLMLGSKKARLTKLNTIRCQSQRDLFIAILEDATSE